VGSISHNFANQTLFKVAFNTQTPKELRVPKQTLKATVQTRGEQKNRETE